MAQCARLIVCAAALFLSTVSARPRLPGPYTIFKTEPSFIPSKIKVTYQTEDRSLLQPGYIFIAPHIVTYGFGPQIIDQDGDLVWYGTPFVTHFQGNPVYAAPIYVCDFMGNKMQHLCFSERHPSRYETQDFREGGAHRIFDNTYQEVGEHFSELGTLHTTPNAHEFNMLPGGQTFVQAVSPIKQYDLTPYKGPRDGWIEDGCFQEVDIHSRSVTFQWCFLDHYEPWESYFLLDVPDNSVNHSHPLSGKGTKADPWDYIHINAIDKNTEGDFLVSGRHISQILKIAGPNSASGLPAGSTIWRLNGKNSDFTFVDEDARFARQHHCRFISTGESETIISLFNNAFNGSYTIPDRSNAMILRLNNVTREASLEAIYKQPRRRMAHAQGSASVMPDDPETGIYGNVFVGWGELPSWSEFARNGTLLYNAKTWADKKQYERTLTNYRAFKQPWVGKPHYPPKIVAYSQTCASGRSSSPLIAYVSWNGATEVGQWRFYVSETRIGLRTLLGTFDKQGFETKVELQSENLRPRSLRSNPAAWVTVEAIDKTNESSVLGMATSRTFVPPSHWLDDCDLDGCFHTSRFEYNSMDGLRCNEQPLLDAVIQLVIFILMIEGFNVLFWGRLPAFPSHRPVKLTRRMKGLNRRLNSW